MDCHGQIQLILGPMFSGKTTELIRRVKRFEAANYKCMVIKYSKDNRYDEGNFISTHDKSIYSATVKCTDLYEYRYLANNYSVVAIDEGQFFKDIVKFSEELANSGKIVVVAALDGTYQRSGFGDILNLVPLSESVVKLTAVCTVCFSDASFTKRKGTETQVELIGGKEAYLAVCRNCYLSNNRLKNDVLNENKRLYNFSKIDNLNLANNLNATKVISKENYLL